jgi:hypothetical protein
MTFVTAYFCETGFLNHAATKSKCRNGINAAPDFEIHLPNMKPNMKTILE